ncbi:MAG: hypothetical protein IGS39_24930 [Calothrix sp. C42_A2020_038]|nr:hypothetical protein [Calothrix sp. C42_A2020_038]
MDFDPQNTPQTLKQSVEFAEPIPRKSLEILRDTEALLRHPTVAAIVPILPAKISRRLEVASSVADNTLNQLAEIDIEQISDWELRPARIRIGLIFVGFSALMLVVLLLYLDTLNPELSYLEQVTKYWYEYIWFVNLGVAGMFILGREAMRQPHS